MRTFARFLAVLVSIAFVVVTVAAVFFHAAGTRLARPEMYKQAIVQADLYGRFPRIVGESMAVAAHTRRAADGTASESAGPGVDLVEALAPADWEILLGAAVPAGYLRAQVEAGLDEVFAFLRGDGSGTAAKISLVELKRRISGPEGEAAYVQMLATKPPCDASMWDPAAGLPIRCRPAPEQMPDVLKAFRGVMTLTAEEIPDEIDPLEQLRQLDGPEGQNQNLAQIRARVRQMEEWAPLSPWICGGLALLVVLLAARSMRGLLLWLGVPCLIAGIIAAMIAVPFVFVGPRILESLVQVNLSAEVPALTLQTLMDVVAALVRQVMMPAAQAAGLLAGGGLVATILAALFRPRLQPAPAPV